MLEWFFIFQRYYFLILKFTHSKLKFGVKGEKRLYAALPLSYSAQAEAGFEPATRRTIIEVTLLYDTQKFLERDRVDFRISKDTIFYPIPLWTSALLSRRTLHKMP